MSTTSLPNFEPALEPHPRAVVLMHWLMVALFVLAIGAIVGRGLLPAGHALRPLLRTTHLLMGQLILLFAVLRVAIRWRSSIEGAKVGPPWSRWAGHASHLALYAVMFVQPISGVLFLQAGDKVVSFAGWALPQFVAPDVELHASLKEFHQLAGTAFYALVALHMGAALWHHFWLKNGTLRRMLGVGRRRAEAPPEPASPDTTPARWPDTQVHDALMAIARRTPHEPAPRPGLPEREPADPATPR